MGISHAVTNGVSVITTHHRCRMGSGVCLIATKAPPWSRYSTAYSSLKICRDTKKQSAPSAAACYPFACPTHPRCLNQVSKVILHHAHTRTHTHSIQCGYACNDYFSLRCLIKNRPHKLKSSGSSEVRPTHQH